MSEASNNQGRAFEFICLIKLHEHIKRIRPCKLEINSCYYAAEDAWNKVSKSIQSNLCTAAVSAIDSILDLEPLIIEDGNDILTLRIQKDTEGTLGDVRDILIVRRGIHWEIGLSLKHNHFAVKHSRLAKKLDFGAKWFGLPCSSEYWKAVTPVFERLEEEKRRGVAWSEMLDKDENVYVPILQAFMDEIKRGIKIYPELPAKMVGFLLGRFDFYKVVSVDKHRYTLIQAFNLRGTLNKGSTQIKSNKTVPVVELPSRLISLGFRQGSTTTVELYFDAGWQFSFRIHNASTLVEPSLKFDIQIIGVPTTIVSFNCIWK